MREWKDEKTGRIVRQLTACSGGAAISKFRKPKYLPGGLIFAGGRDPDNCLLIIDVESGEIQRLNLPVGRILRLWESDGSLWYRSPDGKTIWRVKLPAGQPEFVADNPGPPDDMWQDITCDGRTFVFARNEDDPNFARPVSGDAQEFWKCFARPRRGSIWTCDLAGGRLTKAVETERVCPNHLDTSPVDPGLIRFCHDGFEGHGQRIWTVRADGSELRKIRPTERGEVVTHEFWWPGGQFIAYKYQDRRDDPTMEEKPWSELAPVPTRFALADLQGRECHLSDPLNHYHSHLNVSHDGRFLCGEGTVEQNAVYAARFSRETTRIEFVPLATTHTPCRLFVANQVNTAFTADARWLLYNDTIEGKMQICAVRLELE